jgi:acyl carrier protein
MVPAKSKRLVKICFMSSEDLKEQIRDMLVTNLMLRTPKEEITNDLPLFGPEGLGLDSIDALQLVVSMEKTFGVGIPNSDVARVALATVDSIHDYILQQKRA